MKYEEFKPGQLVYIRARDDFSEEQLEENFTKDQINLLGNIVTVESINPDVRPDGTMRYVEIRIKECPDPFYSDDFLGPCRIQIGDSFRVVNFIDGGTAVRLNPWYLADKTIFSSMHVKIVGYEYNASIPEFGFLIKEDDQKYRWHLNEFVLWTKGAKPVAKRTDPNMLFRMKKGPMIRNPFTDGPPPWATWAEKKSGTMTGRISGGLISPSKKKAVPAQYETMIRLEEVEDLEPYMKKQEKAPGVVDGGFEWTIERVEMAKAEKPKKRINKEEKLAELAKMYRIDAAHIQGKPLPEIKPGEENKEKIEPAIEPEPIVDTSSTTGGWLALDEWDDIDTV